MPKRKPRGMQRLPFKAKAVFFRPIYIVSRNGVLYVRHVNPYLVRASGFEFCGDKRIIAKSFKHGKVCYRTAPVRPHDHLFSVRLMAAYRRVYRAAIFFYVSVYQRQIYSARFVRFHLRGKAPMCVVIFCYYYKAGCKLVYPVHYARAHFAAYAGKIFYVVHYGVHKSACFVTGRRVNHHALRLIYNGNVAVLIYYRQRYIFCGKFGA